MSEEKKPVFKKLWFWVVVILGLAIAASQSEQGEKSGTGGARAASSPATPAIVIPATQAAFIKAVDEAAANYSAASNELKKSAIRTQRSQQLKSALAGSRDVHDWIGTIEGLSTNGEGNAVLSIQLESSDVEVKTWNNALSDISSQTLIPQSSPIFNTIAELDEGTRVVFSGSFPASDKDFVEESSMTESGSMRDPEFIMKFEAVRRYP